MQLAVGARSDVGLIRSGNEDNYLAEANERRGVFVVADAAALSIVIGTDALVGPFTVTVPGVMLAPKLTVVVAPKWVLVPVITIVSLEP